MNWSLKYIIKWVIIKLNKPKYNKKASYFWKFKEFFNFYILIFIIKLYIIKKFIILKYNLIIKLFVYKIIMKKAKSSQVMENRL